MIDVLSVASEAYPLIKTGGLADVTGALPGALSSHGVRMRTLLPGYPEVMCSLTNGRLLASYGDFFGGPAELIAGDARGLDVIAVRADHLYARAGNPYLGPDRKDWPDNWRRFAALSFAAYELGRGVAEDQGCLDDVDFVIGTFSKSVGTVGGFCVSNHPKFEIMRLVCRPYVFTASLPPSVVATAATSIRKLMHGGNKRAHLWENSKRLHGGLTGLGFRLGTAEPQSAIVAVIMPDLERGAAMWEALLHEGLYVNLARPPATPAGMTLLRCSLCAEHSAEEVESILGMFERAGKAVGIN